MKKEDVLAFIKERNIPITIYDGHLQGDCGMPILACYLDNQALKWVVERPIERSNNVYRTEFDTESEAWDYIYRYVGY